MAGANKNYVLGKGKVYFDPFDPNTTVGHGEMYLAQTTEFSYAVAAENLDHYDADEGLNVLDDQVMTQIDITGAMATDDISLEKINLFLLGAGATTTTTASATGSTQTLNNVKLGRYFQLGISSGLPQGLRGVTVTGIATVAVPGTPLTASTNWLQTAEDIALGRVLILSNAATIIDNDDLIVTFNVAVGTRETVVSKDRQLRGALRFVSQNPVGGQRDYYFPLVNMSPDGDYALKGDEWQSMGFSFTALKKDALTERVYVDGRATA